MPSISQYSLIFPCRNIALPTFVTLSLYSFMGFLPYCLSLSPSFSLCTPLLISDILLLFQPLSFAINCFPFFIYWLRLNRFIASLSLFSCLSHALSQNTSLAPLLFLSIQLYLSPPLGLSLFYSPYRYFCNSFTLFPFLSLSLFHFLRRYLSLCFSYSLWYYSSSSPISVQ